jgi:hypothetical protein
MPKREIPASAALQADEQVSRSTVYNIRLSREELAALEQEASAEGLTVAEYLRKAAAMRPEKSILAKPQTGLFISTPYAQSSALYTWSETRSITDLEITEEHGLTISRNAA